MKIDSSQISLAASHQSSSRSEMLETMRAWTGPHPDAGGNAATATPVTISDAARLAAQADRPDQASIADAIDDEDGLLTMDPPTRLLKMMIEMLTGTPIKIIGKADLQVPRNADDAAEAMQEAQRPRDAPANFGVEYHRSEVREETETSAFTASGIIRTTDGKEIRFALSLTMARSYRETREETVLLGNAAQPPRTSKDPLVLNFDGDAAQLHSMRVSFDLDGDGRQEDVPLLAGNRGYLALDLNRNGRVDSGKELFGPLSGDGFADLAQYDGDGNGWIDENDPVFNNLRVWMQDSDGGTLATLKEQGVGAIHLSRTTTPFALNDAGNAALGMVRASGVYLTEDGRAGTVQQIDLIV